MIPVLLYSHAEEPITSALLSSELDQNFNLIKLSLDNLLNDVIIFDEFDESEIQINWNLATGLKVCNSNDFFLINRILSIPEKLFDDFDKEDRMYSLCEFRAYLAFAIEAFPNCFSKPGAFGLSGNRYSLPRQWEKINKANLLVNVPRYYLGNMNHCNLNGEIIYSEPFNFYYWKPNINIDYETSFAFEKPPGEPILACIVGDEIEIYPYHTHQMNKPLSSDNEKKINKLAKEITTLFDYSISESLFFLEDNQVSFGMITNLPYASKNKVWFSNRIGAFFKRILSHNGNN